MATLLADVVSLGTAVAVGYYLGRWQGERVWRDYDGTVIRERNYR